MEQLSEAISPKRMTEEQMKNREINDLKLHVSYLDKKVNELTIIMKTIARKAGIKIERYADITVIESE